MISSSSLSVSVIWEVNKTEFLNFHLLRNKNSTRAECQQLLRGSSSNTCRPFDRTLLWSVSVDSPFNSGLINLSEDTFTACGCDGWQGAGSRQSTAPTFTESPAEGMRVTDGISMESVQLCQNLKVLSLSTILLTYFRSQIHSTSFIASTLHAYLLSNSPTAMETVPLCVPRGIQSSIFLHENPYNCFAT